jgi:DNA-directed RNA polymerase alpha subunit
VVELDSARVGRDAGRVAEEVIAHLAGLVGSEVKITMEIEARLPQGVSEQVIRIVTENSRTLRFKNHGFEAD